jgi:hypothetical protein
MKKFAKKPKILKLKKEIALLIKNKCERSKDYFMHPAGCYWKGTFKFEEQSIYIYWQNYISGRRRDVNYIDIYYTGKGAYDTIYKNELLRIQTELTK